MFQSISIVLYVIKEFSAAGTFRICLQNEAMVLMVDDTDLGAKSSFWASIRMVQSVLYPSASLSGFNVWLNFVELQVS